MAANKNLDKMPSDAAVGRANYEFFLNQVALLPYTPEQLFAISAQEWARAVSFEQYERVRNQGLPELKIAANLEDEIKKVAEQRACDPEISRQTEGF